MKKTLSLLFGLHEPVKRLPYVAWGLSLAVLKFAIETALVYGSTGKLWSPLAYLIPSIAIRQNDVGQGPETMYLLLIISSLPFLWIGLTMSVRRAMDAHWRPWVGALFLLPFANYVMIAALSFAPNRLAFDVSSQPPAMKEWSPYAHVKPPHLEHYMVSKGGEFRLVRLPGDRTRLEGTTHYQLAVYPETYWVIYAEALLHAIHGRVLSHIKRLSELPARSA